MEPVKPAARARELEWSFGEKFLELFHGVARGELREGLRLVRAIREVGEQHFFEQPRELVESDAVEDFAPDGRAAHALAAHEDVIALHLRAGLRNLGPEQADIADVVLRA